MQQGNKSNNDCGVLDRVLSTSFDIPAFSLTGETAVAVRMAVVMRRKLQFYYWKNRKFHKLQDDITVPDVPRSLAWAGDALCFGTR